MYTSDAADIIDSKLKVKINFHELKRLSISENTKDLCEYDNVRIIEPADTKLDAKSYFNNARLQGKKLKTEGTITTSVQG